MLSMLHRISDPLLLFHSFQCVENECKLLFFVVSFGWRILFIVDYCLGSGPSDVSLLDD